jgi:predicted acylesterase/phospholipase RssA
VRLAINAIDSQTGKVVRFVSRGPTADTNLGPEYEVVDAITVDMVVASASIPLLFPPVAVGNHLLWDGGVLVNTPLAPMIDLGADEIVTVLVTEPADPTVRERFANLGDAIERVADTFLENTYNVDRKLLLERNKHPKHGYRAVTLFVPIRPRLGTVFTAGSYLDFCSPSILRMYEEGRRATDAWLAAGPLPDALLPRGPLERRPAA